MGAIAGRRADSTTRYGRTPAGLGSCRERRQRFAEPGFAGRERKAAGSVSTQFLAPAVRPDEDELEQTLRPRRLDEFVGQERVKEQLAIALAAAKARGEALDHVLLVGPPGLGLSYEATSWVGTQQFTSRRFHRRVTQSGQVTDNRYVILPDSARYREEGSSQSWVTPSPTM